MRPMARCIECKHMYQPIEDRSVFFCLKKRDYISHEIDEPIQCESFEPTINA